MTSDLEGEIANLERRIYQLKEELAERLRPLQPSVVRDRLEALEKVTEELQRAFDRLCRFAYVFAPAEAKKADIPYEPPL